MANGQKIILANAEQWVLAFADPVVHFRSISQFTAAKHAEVKRIRMRTMRVAERLNKALVAHAIHSGRRSVCEIRQPSF
ncbi:hypothetical protein B9Z34_10075 [Limnohabitans sp. Hippo3]|nr:hypothetical protein B9Z34_10075 [Limnohabitans sp. Hippo3]